MTKKGVATRVYSVNRDKLLEAIEELEKIAKELRQELEATDESGG